jgi:hypothetical protein
LSIFTSAEAVVCGGLHVVCVGMVILWEINIKKNSFVI